MDYLEWLFKGGLALFALWWMFHPRQEKVKRVPRSRVRQGLLEAQDLGQQTTGLVCAYEKEAFEKDQVYLPVVQFFAGSQEVLVTAPNYQDHKRAQLDINQAVQVSYDQSLEKIYIKR